MCKRTAIGIISGGVAGVGIILIVLATGGVATPLAGSAVAGIVGGMCALGGTAGVAVVSTLAYVDLTKMEEQNKKDSKKITELEQKIAADGARITDLQNQERIRAAANAQAKANNKAREERREKAEKKVDQQQKEIQNLKNENCYLREVVEEAGIAIDPKMVNIDDAKSAKQENSNQAPDNSKSSAASDIGVSLSSVPSSQAQPATQAANSATSSSASSSTSSVSAAILSPFSFMSSVSTASTAAFVSASAGAEANNQSTSPRFFNG